MHGHDIVDLTWFDVNLVKRCIAVTLRVLPAKQENRESYLAPCCLQSIGQPWNSMYIHPLSFHYTFEN